MEMDGTSKLRHRPMSVCLSTPGQQYEALLQQHQTLERTKNAQIAEFKAELEVLIAQFHHVLSVLNSTALPHSLDQERRHAES